MGATPYYTSDQIVSAVQRKIMLPLAQQTFSSDDILAFANEEMKISQVPSVLQFHEEYYTTTEDVPLASFQSRYPVPTRAIGQRLRDLFWKDSSGNLYDMTRVSQDDRAYWQRNIGANEAIHKYYFEGNDVVLTPAVVTDPTGFLTFVYYIRPNELVDNSRAATVQQFFNVFSVNNADINTGDIVYIMGQQSNSGFNNPVNVPGGFYYQGMFIPYDQSYLAQVSLAPTQIPVLFTATNTTPVNDLQFLIGPDSNTTALNLTNTMNAAFPSLDMVGTYNATVVGNTITLTYTVLPLSSTTNTLINFPSGAAYIIPVNAVSTSNTTGGFTINAQTGIIFDMIPSNITDNILVDFLQTNAGHKIRTYSKPIYSISGNTAFFNTLDIPYDMQVGDYICQEHECIIPYLPDDLHIALIERTCSRILASMGDMQGLQVVDAKLADIEKRSGTLVDNRSEGNPQKITARGSLLRYFKMGPNRRN